MSGLDKDRKRNQTIAFRMTPLSNVNNKGDDGVESGLFHWKQDCG